MAAGRNRRTSRIVYTRGRVKQLLMQVELFE